MIRLSHVKELLFDMDDFFDNSQGLDHMILRLSPYSL